MMRTEFLRAFTRRPAALALALLLTWRGVDAAGPVMLNFANAEIDTVVRAIGQISGKNFLVDPRVKGTISITSVKPVSPDMAYQILVSSLRMQGYAVVEGRGVVKVLPEADAKQHYSPIFGKSVSIGGGQVATQVYPLEHASAAQLVTVLRPLIASNHAISAYPGANALVITDYADNLKRISEIIEAIDKPNEAAFTVIKVHHLSAIELAQQLMRLYSEPLAQGQQPAGPTGMSIVADTRSNNLLVRTDSAGKLAKLRDLVAQLDMPSVSGGNLQVVHLRNAEATKLAETLRSVAHAEVHGAATPSAAPGSATPSAAPGIATTGGVIILADAPTNSLVIRAPDHLYNSLRAVIDKLDAQRAQIFVEALIVEVTSDKAAELGVQWLAPIETSDNNLIIAGSLQRGGPITDPSSVGGGGVLGLVHKFTWGGKEYTNLALLARALQADTEANVLSTPTLLTLDNEEAKIVIGQNVPFITGSYSQVGTGALVNPFQTIERKDVGITLQVKPLIVEGGKIKLKILQEASSVQPKATLRGDGAVDLITNKRSIETTVLVDDGRAVVLGGLIQEDMQTSNDKVPGLGDLPWLGALFRSESRSRVKTNLMVFLRPVVVNTPETMQRLTESRYDYLREVYGRVHTTPSKTLLPTYAPLELPDLKMDNLLVSKPRPPEPGVDAGKPPRVDGAKPQKTQGWLD